MSQLHAGATTNGKMAWCLGCQTWLTQAHPYWSYAKRVALHERGTGHPVQWRPVDFTQGWDLVPETPQVVIAPEGGDDVFPRV